MRGSWVVGEEGEPSALSGEWFSVEVTNLKISKESGVSEVAATRPKL
jgi:hypothetical protein